MHKDKLHECEVPADLDFAGSALLRIEVADAATWAESVKPEIVEVPCGLGPLDNSLSL
ncbi:MAG TPA: hypothetical protein VMZ92_12165 [Planctomycetota bacterium]|nr:hypothetical protein [Planctomycetota bacterium]